MKNGNNLSRREKIQFLKQFSKYGIIIGDTVRPIRTWICDANGLYSCEEAKKANLSELEMIGYLNNEGKLFANIICFIQGPPLASSEEEVDMTPYTGPYYTPPPAIAILNQ